MTDETTSEIQRRTDLDEASAELVRIKKLHDRMSQAFALVETPGDWKAPIKKIVYHHELELAGLTLNDVREAISYFTATEAEVSDIDDRCVRVTAVGYRMGPAGP